MHQFAGWHSPPLNPARCWTLRTWVASASRGPSAPTSWLGACSDHVRHTCCARWQLRCLPGQLHRAHVPSASNPQRHGLHREHVSVLLLTVHLPVCCRGMASTADIVFMPYNYLIDSKTRGGLGIQWQNAVLIFDEAHNVEVSCVCPGCKLGCKLGCGPGRGGGCHNVEVSCAWPGCKLGCRLGSGGQGASSTARPSADHQRGTQPAACRCMQLSE